MESMDHSGHSMGTDNADKEMDHSGHGGQY